MPPLDQLAAAAHRRVGQQLEERLSRATRNAAWAVGESARAGRADAGVPSFAADGQPQSSGMGRSLIMGGIGAALAGDLLRC